MTQSKLPNQITAVDEFNPNPVLVFEPSGKIVGSNAAARATLLATEGTTLAALFPAAHQLNLASVIREDRQTSLCAQVGDRLYRFLIHGVSKSKCGYLHVQDISDVHLAHADLRALLEVTRALTQENLFNALVRNIAQSCSMAYAVIATYTEAQGGRAVPIAAWNDGLFVDEAEFSLAGTPFHDVLTGTPAVLTIRSGVHRRYPGCTIAKRLKAQSFIGITVEHGEGERIAFLGLYHRKPLETTATRDIMLRLFASCAAGELQRRQAESRFQRVLVTFEQQLKELSCIYGLAESLRTRESVKEICEDLVLLIPPAWRFPDLARARIILDGVEYASKRFLETKWGQSAAVIVDGRARGMVQVFYVDDVQTAATSEPFLASERKLLDAVARTLGEAVERREIEADNRRKAITLAQERNRLETILRGIGEGVVVTDTRDRVLMMNHTAQRLLGFAEREPLATDFLTLLEDDGFRSMWRETAETGIDIAKADVRLGEPYNRTLSVTRSRIPELIQGEDCYVTILHDVTKEREIDQMKTDFVSGVSHELRTPMTSIKGFANTLLRNPHMQQDKREHFLRIIDEEAERLMALIEEVLEIGSIESGRAILNRTMVDVAGLIGSAVGSLSSAMESKQIQFTQDVEKGLPPLFADPTKLHTIVCNLLENAIKFTNLGGSVNVNAHRDVDDIVLEVADTGIGIPADHTDHIFERFYQVNAGTRKSAGAGLGLFLVKEMVRLHGGTVAVQSEVDKKTTFVVRLPLKASAPNDSGDS
jgi:two-component system phosphate regulon sensor histidine kinase PhoR